MYKGQYPNRIKSVSYCRKNGLLVITNCNKRYHAQIHDLAVAFGTDALGQAKRRAALPKCGTEIEPWLLAYFSDPAL